MTLQTSLSKNAALIALTLFVTGCVGTGTGVKGVDQILTAIESDDAAVLVMRQTGFPLGSSLVEVSVNRVPVGDLGNKEFLMHPVSAGDHTLNVRFTGFGGIGLNNVMETFSLTAGEKAYFEIRLNQSLFTTELVLMGVTKETFISSGR